MNNQNSNNLNNLYNTSYDPNNDPTRDFTAGSSTNGSESFKVLMGSTNDIRNQKPDPTEALIEDYIGKNSKKILNNKYNLSAFVFNAFYLFYRKLFGVGILLSIIIAVSSYYTNVYIISTVIALICCFGFNPLYVMLVKKRVKAIQKEHPDATYEQLKSICEKEGGTSGSLIVKGIFTNIFIAILVVVVLITLGIGTTWKKIFNDFDFKEILSIFKKEEYKTEYDGSYLSDEKVNFEDYFTFTIPGNYVKKSNNEYTYNKETETCKISFKNILEYKASTTFINSMQKYYEKDLSSNKLNLEFGYYASDVEIKSYNKVNWEGFHMNWSMGTDYLYVTDYKNKIFLVELKDNSYSNECSNDIYKLLETIETK